MILGLSIFIILIYLFTGAIIGWLAGVIMQGKGFGFFGNIVIAIIGSIIGGVVLRIFGIHPHGLLSFLSAVGGAVLLLWIISILKN